MIGRLCARDVMTRQVITVRPETPVKEVAGLMLTHRVSGLPVVTLTGELVGIVTEADLLYKETPPESEGGRPRRGLLPLGRAAEAVRKAEGVRAQDVMTAPVVTVGEATPLREVAALMVRRRINRVPVIRDGRLVGIVSRADVLRALTRDDEELARAVREALLHDLWLDVHRITVAVRDGVVTLEGTVERRSERELAGRWVAALDGVVAVENRLTFEYDDRDVTLAAPWPPAR
ncbi:MAG: CBS domain-containing protein [Armatimonadota bacterium]|nr:CBS domain-containing protein [Armatimonadota bacterium]MDR7450540.1 CBS domain-containing protein [Armatimonadota bacterium]MDR7466327.1 CBS domain-containing protein [Armatimonadota bacterium]MDR7493048.1 CBS domain-containing protein [Armatimonadota bacterium]MDR7498195.1 CBS domain-containing protein [Armatimonadota bacterium]